MLSFTVRPLQCKGGAIADPKFTIVKFTGADDSKITSLCLCSECVHDLMSLEGWGGEVGGGLLGGGGGSGDWVPE